MNRRRSHPEDLESIKARFLQEREAGKGPTLEQYAHRYPRFARELVDFIVTAVELEAAERQEGPLPKAASEATEEAVREVLQAVSAPVTSLSQAREGLRWTTGRLARELNLPETVVEWIEQGLLRAYPRELHARLAEVLARPVRQIGPLLRGSAEGAAPPTLPPADSLARPGNPRTFREALLALDHKGQLSAAQRREWLLAGDSASADAPP